MKRICNFIAIATTTILISCSSSDSKEPQKTVYVTGNQIVLGISVAVLWVNGVRSELDTSTSQSLANDVFVSGSDVYVCGVGLLGAHGASLWKNGEAQSLNEAAIRSEANAVFVSGTDVYVVGNVYNGSYTYAALWKNGIETVLTDSQGSANDVLVSGSDVYVCGYQREGGHTVAKLWKNNVSVPVSNATGHILYSIAISGSNIYLAGLDVYAAPTHGRPKLWTNNVITTLSDLLTPQRMISVFADGTNVYVLCTLKEAEVTQFTTSVVWKNGVRTFLTDGFSRINTASIFVSGSDVYAAGDFWYPSPKRVAYFWKNGVPQALSDGTADHFVTSIFVK